ncbi:MAG: YihY/virulence factor BrkB family protein [Phycisphaerae bacterium]|nr:YihY/virulence factor BrkB family protein [Phycisphaerae bacterium]MDW8263408.1 YihY/virulence factor BrkB family protein [Phycisphaerales bacterium]
MARLGDLPHVLRTIGPWSFVRRVWRETLDDHVFTWAAALAYSWMFAIFPFLIFLLALLPYLPEQFKRPATTEIKEMIAQAIPSQAGQTLQQAVDRLFENPAGGLLTVGILVALYAASGGMNATMAALDRAYDVEIGRKFVQQRVVAILLTITVATLILLVLCLMPVTTQVLNFFEIRGWQAAVINVLRYTLATVLCLTILSLIYHFGPSVRSHWTWITPGSLFVVTVWILVAFGFRFYIDHFAAASYARTYGVVGSIVLLLLVLYVDAIVLLIGAEINSEIDFAVLGLTSSANPQERSIARQNLSEKERFMASELQKRRPAAMSMLAARGLSAPSGRSAGETAPPPSAGATSTHQSG